MSEKRKKALNVAVLVHTPMVPNFLRFVDSGGTIRVGECSDTALRQVGRAWTDALLANAAKQRKQSRGGSA